MVGGIDRYYQIATCWRDEDLRADRQFEFRQLDLEMAFVEREDVLDVMEACVVGAFEAAGVEPPQRPFPHLTYADAMLRYGSDKPDLRFGLEIQDATEVTRGSEFGVFKNAPCVRYVVVPRTFSRSEQARLEEVAKEWGAKGLANLTQISKFLSERELEAFGVEEGSTALFVADEESGRGARPRAPPAAPRARARPDRHDASTSSTGSPTSRSSSTVRSTAAGRSCTTRSPRRCRATRSGSRRIPEHVLGQHYDLIWNGWELGSGSIRIHEAEVQQAVFRVMGMGEEEQRDKFGFLLDALQMGAPPHGGFAMGHRPLHRAARARAGHPPGDRVPEDRERRRSADGGADAVSRLGAEGARDPAARPTTRVARATVRLLGPVRRIGHTCRSNAT